MRKVFLFIAICLSMLSQAQTWNGNRVTVKQGITIRTAKVDTVRNDTTGMSGRIKSILTADAVYKFVTGRLAGVTGTSAWGAITGTIGSQTDLMQEFGTKVDTGRTITINGIAYSLAANRSWTIAQRFGLPNEDTIASANRVFNLSGYKFRFKNGHVVVDSFILVNTQTREGFAIEAVTSDANGQGLLLKSHITSGRVALSPGNSSFPPILLFTQSDNDVIEGGNGRIIMTTVVGYDFRGPSPLYNNLARFRHAQQLAWEYYGKDSLGTYEKRIGNNGGRANGQYASWVIEPYKTKFGYRGYYFLYGDSVGVKIPSLATGGSAPATTGVTKMVITDENGQTSFTDIPSGGGGATDLSIGTRTATDLPLNSSTGADVSLPLVTNALAGIMSAADKARIDSNQYIKPGEGIDTVWVNDSTLMLKLKYDTVAIASFGAGGGQAGDTVAFSTSTIYGSFFHDGSDTLIITKLRIGLQGTSPSITADLFWNDSLNVSAGATKLVTAGTAATNIYEGTTVTSFNNTKIPPGNWVWVKTSSVTTKPTYFTLTIVGYKKRVNP